MPFHLNGELHEWFNEVEAVPSLMPSNPQLGERARPIQRGKKTLSRLTLVWYCEGDWKVQCRWKTQVEIETPPLLALLCLLEFLFLNLKLPKTLSNGEFIWGGMPRRFQPRHPKVSSARTETWRGT